MLETIGEELHQREVRLLKSKIIAEFAAIFVQHRPALAALSRANPGDQVIAQVQVAVWGEQPFTVGGEFHQDLIQPKIAALLPPLLDDRSN